MVLSLIVEKDHLVQDMDTKQKLDKETEKDMVEEIQMEVLDPKALEEVEIEETHMEENHYMKEAKTEIINARVTKGERILLKMIAKHQKKTISDLIRDGIKNYKNTHNAV